MSVSVMEKNPNKLKLVTLVFRQKETNSNATVTMECKLYLVGDFDNQDEISKTQGSRGLF